MSNMLGCYFPYNLPKIKVTFHELLFLVIVRLWVICEIKLMGSSGLVAAMVKELLQRGERSRPRVCRALF
jgi:hypothetical protein